MGRKPLNDREIGPSTGGRCASAACCACRRRARAATPGRIATPRRLRRVNAVAATAFVLGGSLFAIGAALAQAGASADRSTARSTWPAASSSAPAATPRVLQADQRPARGRRGRRLLPSAWHWWASEPDRLEWLSAVVLFVGTLVFAINIVDSFIDGLGAGAEDRLVWSPDMIGCALFLISGHLAMRRDRARLACWRPRDLGWWIVAVNQLGSVLFMVAAIASFVRPSSGDEVGGRHRQLGHPDRRPLLRGRRRDAGVRAAGSRALAARRRLGRGGPGSGPRRSRRVS